MPVPYAPVQVGKQAVEVVVDLEVIAGRLVKQYPSAAAEHIDVPFIVIWEQADNQFPQGFLASYPCHKAVDG